MRALTNKQQKVILNEMSKSDVYSYDDLSTEIQEQLDKLNLYENIISDVNRFISDTRFKMLYGKE